MIKTHISENQVDSLQDLLALRHFVEDFQYEYNLTTKELLEASGWKKGKFLQLKRGTCPP